MIILTFTNYQIRFGNSFIISAFIELKSHGVLYADSLKQAVPCSVRKGMPSTSNWPR